MQAPVTPSPSWRFYRLLSLYLGLGGAGGFSSEDGSENGIQSEGQSAQTGSLTEKDKVVLDFHYYNYAFCKERRFDACATSTFLSIMKDILDEVSTDTKKRSFTVSNITSFEASWNGIKLFVLGRRNHRATL